jgi:hypothetical protein
VSTVDNTSAPHRIEERRENGERKRKKEEERRVTSGV